jgi:hypothetical protein
MIRRVIIHSTCSLLLLLGFFAFSSMIELPLSVPLSFIIGIGCGVTVGAVANRLTP